MTRLISKQKLEYLIVGRLEQFHQTLCIARAVLQHVRRHRQSKPWATEAGGQLFGAINSTRVCVIEASGPYAGDERSRYRYRSNTNAAQLAIEDHHRRGLLYLGEWHTHAEDRPSASNLDDDAMRRLIVNSRLNSNALLMLIVGRAPDVAGIAAWNISSSDARQWILSDSEENA